MMREPSEAPEKAATAAVMTVPYVALGVPLPPVRPGAPTPESYALVLPPLIALIVALIDTGMDSYEIATRLHGLNPGEH